jgi:hypothetical protein
MTAGWSNRDLIELITINEINLRCHKYLTHAKCNTLDSLLRGHRKRKEDLNQATELVRDKQSYRTAPVEEVVRMLEADIKQYFDLCGTLRGRIHVPRTYNETIPPRELQALLEDAAAALSIAGRTGPELWENLLGKEGLVKLVESAYAGEGIENVNHRSVFAHVGTTFGSETPELEITIGGETVKIGDASSVENAQAYLKHVSEWLGELCEEPTAFSVGYSSVCSDVYKTNQIVLAWNFLTALRTASCGVRYEIMGNRVFGSANMETGAVVALLAQVKEFVDKINTERAHQRDAIEFVDDGPSGRLYEAAAAYFQTGTGLDEVLGALELFGITTGLCVEDENDGDEPHSAYGFERSTSNVWRLAQAIASSLLSLSEFSRTIKKSCKLELRELRHITGNLTESMSPAASEAFRAELRAGMARVGSQVTPKTVAQAAEDVPSGEKVPEPSDDEVMKPTDDAPPAAEQPPVDEDTALKAEGLTK